jgi:hypothetical protein
MRSQQEKQSENRFSRHLLCSCRDGRLRACPERSSAAPAPQYATRRMKSKYLQRKRAGMRVSVLFNGMRDPRFLDDVVSGSCRKLFCALLPMSGHVGTELAGVSGNSETLFRLQNFTALDRLFTACFRKSVLICVDVRVTPGPHEILQRYNRSTRIERD